MEEGWSFQQIVLELGIHIFIYFLFIYFRWEDSSTPAQDLLSGRSPAEGDPSKRAGAPHILKNESIHNTYTYQKVNPKWNLGLAECLK
jgi:hypothetical protein